MSNVIALPTSPTTRDPAGSSVGPVAQPDQTRRVDAAAANRERGGGADRGELRRTQHLDLETGLLGHGLGAIGKLLRSQCRGGFVAEVAGQVDTPGHGVARLSARSASALDISRADESAPIQHRARLPTQGPPLLGSRSKR